MDPQRLTNEQLPAYAHGSFLSYGCCLQYDTKRFLFVYSGQLPSVAELNYLDKVKWLEMYGVDLHPVLVSYERDQSDGICYLNYYQQGEDNVEYFLGLTPSGIIVLRNKNTVGNYYWPRISKIYFKGRYFMLRVTDKNVTNEQKKNNLTRANMYKTF